MNRIRILIALSICSFPMVTSCDSEPAEEKSEGNQVAVKEEVMDIKKWRTREDDTYPYREEMLQAIISNDTIRSLSKPEILDLLGKPDRENDAYFYYLISETKLFAWPLSTKYMVIKFADNGPVEWIRIHD